MIRAQVDRFLKRLEFRPAIGLVRSNAFLHFVVQRFGRCDEGQRSFVAPGVVEREAAFSASAASADQNATHSGSGFPFVSGANGKCRHSEQEHETHGHAGIPHRLRLVSVDAAGQQTQRQRSDGGHEAADVVAERRAGAPQTGREELGQIDRVAAEKGQLAEAHQRDHPEDVAEIFQIPERERGGEHRSDERDKRRPSCGQSCAVTWVNA